MGFYSIYMWWRDIIREATLEEQHTFSVQRSLRLGMLLFIVSEIMFFFAFFWAFFHSSLSPTYNIGAIWPPEAIEIISSSCIPLTNTFFLLSSGITVTWAHHAIISRAKKHAIIALLWTLILAILFTSLFEFFLIILQIRIILDLKLVHGIGILLGRPKNNTKLKQFLTKSLKLLKLRQDFL